MARIANTTARLPTENYDSDIEIIAETTSSTALSIIQPEGQVEAVQVVETKKKRKGKAKQPDKGTLFVSALSSASRDASFF